MLGTGWQGCQIECSELAVDWVAEIVVWVPSCSAGPWAVSLSSLCHLTDNCHRHKLQPSPVQPCQPSLDYILPQNHPAALEIHIYWFFNVQTVAMFASLNWCILVLSDASKREPDRGPETPDNAASLRWLQGVPKLEEHHLAPATLWAELRDQMRLGSAIIFLYYLQNWNFWLWFE